MAAQCSKGPRHAISQRTRSRFQPHRLSHLRQLLQNHEEETNACKIYSERPQACREFPHTDRKNMREILGITEQNAHLCPAVSSVVQSILDEVND